MKPRKKYKKLHGGFATLPASSLAHRILKFRKANNLSQERAAHLFGMSNRTIVNLEQGGGYQSRTAERIMAVINSMEAGK